MNFWAYLRNEWRAIASFLVTALIILLLATLHTGCTTAPAGSGLFGWWTGRGERAVIKAEAKRDTASADLLRRAQERVQEAVVALLTAPPSRPVEVAAEANAQASALLAQVNGPLTVAQLASVRAQVEALLSDNEALRAEGERLRTAARAADATAAQQLAALTAKLQAADARAAEIAADNARLAARYLAAKWTAAALAALSALATLAAWAYRTNALGLATGAGEMLGTLRARYGVDDADVRDLTALLDAPTKPSTQRQIADIAARTAAQFLTAKRSAP